VTARNDGRARTLGVSEQRASALPSGAVTEAPEPPVTAVILAAGEGSRLGQPSKPLARVAGLTLLERAVATLRAAGIEHVIVVVGHAKEEIARFVHSRALDVVLVENERFDAGNGASAVAGGQVAGERFLLMMCDHVIEPAALERMLTCDSQFGVAVDTQPVSGDLDEATKVKIDAGAVVRVGRDLDHWDAVDAGVFVCARSVVAAAEAALAAGEGTWNAVKRRWIAEGRRLDAIDVAGCLWIDVDTPADVRRAERLLVERAAAKPLDGVISRWLNRPLSSRLSEVLVRHGVSPTQASLGTFLLALVAAVTVAAGSVAPVALVVGGLLVQLASALDGCDGEIARATLRSSRFGALLDSLLDRVADAAVLVALALAAGFDTIAAAALAAASFAAVFVPYVKAAFESATKEPFPPSRLTFGRDARMLVAAVGAVALQPLAALVAVAAISSAEGGVRLVRALRAARAL
jgi:choline kinase/phosphatidylglycerophosphate synthase